MYACLSLIDVAILLMLKWFDNEIAYVNSVILFLEFLLILVRVETWQTTWDIYIPIQWGCVLAQARKSPVSSCSPAW